MVIRHRILRAIISAAVILFTLFLSTDNLYAYSTYLEVAAHDFENDPDYVVVHENDLTATATAQYSGRTDRYGRTLSAYAFGGFTLSSGELKFKLQAQGQDAEALAKIYITETIYPQWELPSMQDEAMNIHLSWSMDGVYEPNGGLRNLALSSVCGYGVDSAAAAGSLSLTNLVDGHEEWYANVFFDPNTDEYLEIGIWVNAWIQPYSQLATADFSSTGYFDITMPEGAIFESSSGEFLAGSSAVPLPAAFWLLGGGLTGIAALRRRLNG
jgi:hypothetical protein